jgi:hypothetical protein
MIVLDISQAISTSFGVNRALIIDEYTVKDYILPKMEPDSQNA